MIFFQHYCAGSRSSGRCGSISGKEKKKRPSRISDQGRRLGLPLTLLCLTLLAACAPTTRTVQIDEVRVEAEAEIQRRLAFEALQEQTLKLRKIAYPLLIGAAPICGANNRPVLGVQFANRFLFDEAYREIASQFYHLDDRLKIIVVLPGSAADRAGLAPGDFVRAINNEPLSQGPEAMKSLHEQLGRHLTEGTTLRFTIARNGREQEVAVSPDRSCSYPVLLGNTDAVNAYADGTKIVITRGMLRFIEKAQELRMVIAHELAHNAMGHIRAQQGNYTIGSILDIAISAAIGINTQGIFSRAAGQIYSREFEAEADYVGLYMMALAGFEIDGAANFWRRMAATHPDGITKDPSSSHPSTPERFVAIEETIKEIKNKQAAGQPLRPELKK